MNDYLLLFFGTSASHFNSYRPMSKRGLLKTVSNFVGDGRHKHTKLLKYTNYTAQAVTQNVK